LNWNTTSNKTFGVKSNIINAEHAKMFNVFVGLFRFKENATRLNMSAALVTDADNPAITANTQRQTMIRIILYMCPCLINSIGLKKKFKNNNIIPTCKPETANRSEEHTSELQSRENLVCRL